MNYFNLKDENKETEAPINADCKAFAGNKDGKRKDKEKPKFSGSSIIKNSLLIILVSTIFFTCSFLIYLGMFVFLKTHTETVQNVTVRSEGPIREVGKSIFIKNRVSKP